MDKKKPIFEHNKHQKLWKVMPEYIKKVAVMNPGILIVNIPVKDGIEYK